MKAVIVGWYGDLCGSLIACVRGGVSISWRLIGCLVKLDLQRARLSGTRCYSSTVHCVEE